MGSFLVLSGLNVEVLECLVGCVDFYDGCLDYKICQQKLNIFSKDLATLGLLICVQMI